VPDGQKQFTDLNVELAKAWVSITKTKGPLADADDWKDKTDKLPLLDRG
jgi:ferredoxin